jgi:benzoyl-CoA reductase/2-hydroxyglutaryl-CoA dehydratase subunit BcrC/BadD/HgdB
MKIQEGEGNLMETKTTPLFNDGMDGLPSKRVLHYVEAQKAAGRPVVGIYCGFAPIELIQAMDLVPAVLCAFSQTPIATAETVLPANLCPLIKSSYGFIEEGTCPFYNMAQAVVAETTCDGKKKMFELIAEIKPTHVMDLPSLPADPDALDRWATMIGKLQGFLEQTFDRRADSSRIEAAIQATNRKNRLLRQIFGYAAHSPSLISWQELFDVCFLAMPVTGDEMVPQLETLLDRLEERRNNGYGADRKAKLRVLVTGCPVGGDATKVFTLIEEAGGAVVALDSCTGMKPFMDDIAENSADPIRALAERYLKIPCACMTPNDGRLKALSRMIERFKPDVVVEVVLQFCHTYNVESFKIDKHVHKVHGLPYLKIETDYGTGDKEQLRTRIEAFLEMAGEK